MPNESADLTMEEMLNECERVRVEYRQETLDRLSQLLNALNKGTQVPITYRTLWVLQEDGRTVKYSSPT